MNLIFLGAPGAGKGTQAEVVSEALNIPQISTGNILREAAKNGTEYGLKAKAAMDAGALVSDDIVIGILKERIAEDDCKNGFILDGFPRTVPQAEALDQMNIRIDKVIEIDVADETIKQRVSGRRVCQGCGASYHVEYKPSKVEGVWMISRKSFSTDLQHITRKQLLSRTITRNRASLLPLRDRKRSLKLQNSLLLR